MKKVLLTLSLLGAVVLGRTQIVLNEVYTSPGNNKHEFFELYNSSISPTAISLDCYTLVSYYSNNNGSKRGFYVIDIPNLSINPKSYFVGAAANPFNVQNRTNVTASFNWNSPGSGGSIRKYELNTAGNGYISSALTAAEGADIFSKSNPADYAIFLFNAGQLVNGNATYVNGLLGKYNSTSVPAVISSMPAISGLSNTCGSYSVNWAAVTSAEFVTEADGNDNGYARVGNGLCGSWVKASNSHTPGTANPTGTVTPVSSLTTSERLVCDKRIDFTISSPASGNMYPVEVQLYYDNGTIGSLDAADVYQASVNVASGSTTVYSFPNNNYTTALPTGQRLLLVYKTALGCFDKVVAPTAASGQLTTTEKNLAGKRIDFSVNGATGDVVNYSLPVEVELYHDVNGNGLLDEDTTNAQNMIAERMVSSFSSPTYSFSLSSTSQKVVLVYKTAASCFSRMLVPQMAVGSLNTAEEYLCGSNTQGARIGYMISGASGDANAQNTLPVTVELYYDNAPFGVFDNNDVLKQQETVTAFMSSGAYFTLPLADKNPNVFLVYKTSSGAFENNPIFLESGCIVTPVQFKSFTASRKNEQVVLVWETASELNNSGFNVQRKVNGVWKTVAFVPTKAERGNSSSVLSYEYKEAAISRNSVTEYRIEQVDLDGKLSYSAVRSVRGEGQGVKVMVFPNPTSNGKVTVLFEDAKLRDVMVNDAAGRVVKIIRGVAQNQLEIEGLVSGFYTIKITDRNTAVSSVERVVVK